MSLAIEPAPFRLQMAIARKKSTLSRPATGQQMREEKGDSASAVATVHHLV